LNDNVESTCEISS